MLKRLIFLLLVLVLFYGYQQAKAANTAPIGDPVLNQGVQALAVTTSDSAYIASGNNDQTDGTVGTTPSVPIPTRAIYNGNATACNIALLLTNDTSAVTFQNVQSGAILPFAAIKVMTTGTTCSNIVALF